MASLPVLYYLGERVPSNNDIETWLPRNSEIRTQYDEFCSTFGADESVLIAFERPFPDQERINSFAGRLRGIKGIGSCWTRDQVYHQMLGNHVEPEVAEARLVNLLATKDHALETVMVSINQEGLANRAGIVQAIRNQLAYCELNEAVIVGGPIVTTRLDQLGSRKQAAFLFTLTLATCFVLMRLNIGCWKTAGVLMLANILAIEATLTLLWLVGQEMNFILSSLPVMVMVFTTAASIHYIGHYRHEYGSPDAAAKALAGVITPAAFATLTTVIGLGSLAVSDVGPIPAFGVAGAIGTFISFVVGVFLTPAILLSCRYQPPAAGLAGQKLNRFATQLLNRPLRTLIPGLLITLICAGGVPQLRSLISPLDFLPGDDQVVHDTVKITNTLTSPTTIEGVVDFGNESSSFVERLRRVRKLEAQVAKVDNVCHVMSLGDFFPNELNGDTLSLSKLGSSSRNAAVSSMMVDGSRLWRLSIRLHDDSPSAVRRTFDQLKADHGSGQVHFTGLGPLLEVAQTQIFEGFWRSFAWAFVLITIVMVAALRSPMAGLVAMIPNLTPILLVFGVLGWSDYPIDIGIMMTASIALGLAVDGTFHFLFSYQNSLRSLNCRYRAVRTALFQTGMPIISSAVISGTGLLALAFSPFRPTMKFGLLMFCLLNCALIGDLILLPAFLAIKAKRRRIAPRRQANATTRAAA